uniref:Uncharacterized protein n=3 Tax=Aegilops tauschii subsp. strangulata TaxID=200361 RepID=A0A453CX78_AEGTS
GDLGRSSPVSGNGGRAPLLLHPWYSSSHLSRLNDICCVAKASAAHHQHLRPRILLPLHPEARRHDGSSKVPLMPALFLMAHVLFYSERPLLTLNFGISSVVVLQFFAGRTSIVSLLRLFFNLSSQFSTYALQYVCCL